MARRSNKELMAEVKSLKCQINDIKNQTDYEDIDRLKKDASRLVVENLKLEEMNKSLEERKNNEIGCLQLKLEGRDKKIENYEKILIAVAAKFETVSVVANSAISDLIGKRG